MYDKEKLVCDQVGAGIDCRPVYDDGDYRNADEKRANYLARYCPLISAIICPCGDHLAFLSIALVSLRLLLLGDHSIDKFWRNWRSKAQESFGSILRFDFQGCINSVGCLFEPYMSGLSYRVADMIVGRLTQTDRDAFGVFNFRGDAHSFKRQFMCLFLSAEFGIKNLKRREPTFMLTAEAIEEGIPFLTWYFSSRHW